MEPEIRSFGSSEDESNTKIRSYQNTVTGSENNDDTIYQFELEEASHHLIEGLYKAFEEYGIVISYYDS